MTVCDDRAGAEESNRVCGHLAQGQAPDVRDAHAGSHDG